MLTKGDDYPIHQTPEPIAYAGSDRNFYDRYFFNGYSPDGRDFYATVSRTFVADPVRDGDLVLEALLGLARPDETWLDIGAGAGRYALPLARRVRRVVAVDPSGSMLEALREGMAAHGIANIGTVEGRWPPDDALRAALGPDPLADAAAGIVEHVNRDHAAALVACARHFAGEPAEEARMVAVDRLGFKPRFRGGRRRASVRIAFPREVTTAADARAALIELLREARA